MLEWMNQLPSCWAVVLVALRCSNNQRASVTVLSHKNWIGSLYNEYSIIISLPVQQNMGLGVRILYCIYPGFIQSECSRPQLGVFFGQRAETMAPIGAQGYYDPITKTEDMLKGYPRCAEYKKPNNDLITAICQPSSLGTPFHHSHSLTLPDTLKAA